MFPLPRIRTLSWSAGPLEVAAAWPADQPLLMLHSADPHERWGRWSILAAPGLMYRFDGRSRLIGSPQGGLADVRFTDDPLRDLDVILAATRLPASANPGDVPFCGGWIGAFSYDLGRWIEPRAQHGVAPSGPADWPLIELGWCPWALVHDAIAQRWLAIGDVPREFLDASADRLPLRGSPSDNWHAGPLQPLTSSDAYLSAVERTIEYIRAGDVFQANIAQRFSARFEGSARAFAVHALQTSGARYGALLEFGGEDAGNAPGRTAISLSPELFLHVDAATRAVTTRPIKGTRPAASDPDELRRSEKDAAELHMIVDLMRNDLGRVCEFGSVRVPHPRIIESYPTVHHGVAEVTGRLRPRISIGDMLRATFPGGSVTGAPKIRAMQIIDELESARRGPYCGAIGYISDDGGMGLNIAIRTALIDGRRAPDRFDCLDGELRYSAGCGIVADSDPLAEYRESLDKAAVLRLALEREPAAALRP